MGLYLKLCISTTLAVGIALLTTVAAIDVKQLCENVQKIIPIKQGTEAADRFVKSPITSYIKFYMFNVTNKDEVNNHGAVPELQELGPYVYRLEKTKVDLKWDSKLATVKYHEKERYFFEPDLSKGRLEDEINYLNVIAVIHGSFFSLVGLRSSNLVITNSVNEIMFEGVDAMSLLPQAFQPMCDMLIPDCRIGFYFHKNNTLSEEFEVSTGELSLKNIGEIIAYKNRRELEYWTEEQCNTLKGTDGRQFPPGVDKDKDLYVFSSDICRSLRIKYDDDVTHQGIHALRYVVPPEVFADPNKDKNNMCFCGDFAVNETCPSKAGIIPLGKCRRTRDSDPITSVYASPPHFYLGDQEYIDNFKGLAPNKKEHQTYLDVEPITGIVISSIKRTQTNILVVPDESKKFELLRFVKKPFFFPVYWVEEGGVIDEGYAKVFREELLKPFQETQ